MLHAVLCLSPLQDAPHDPGPHMHLGLAPSPPASSQKASCDHARGLCLDVHSGSSRVSAVRSPWACDSEHSPYNLSRITRFPSSKWRNTKSQVQRKHASNTSAALHARMSSAGPHSYGHRWRQNKVAMSRLNLTFTGCDFQSSVSWNRVQVLAVGLRSNSASIAANESSSCSRLFDFCLFL